MEDSVFSAFDAYDFENNINFQKGWAAIKTVVDSEALDKEYLKAKAFFFSKYVDSIDLEKYKIWKSETGNVLEEGQKSKDEEHTDGSSTSKGMEENVSATSSCSNYESSSNHQRTEKEKESKSCEEIPKDIQNDISGHINEQKADKNEESENDDFLSLAELSVLVQNGIPIPGLISVDVHPTNKDPTPSSMPRKPKPWEMKPSQVQHVGEGNQDIES